MSPPIQTNNTTTILTTKSKENSFSNSFHRSKLLDNPRFYGNELVEKNGSSIKANKIITTTTTNYNNNKTNLNFENVLETPISNFNSGATNIPKPSVLGPPAQVNTLKDQLDITCVKNQKQMNDNLNLKKDSYSKNNNISNLFNVNQNYKHPNLPSVANALGVSSDQVLPLNKPIIPLKNLIRIDNKHTRNRQSIPTGQVNNIEPFVKFLIILIFFNVKNKIKLKVTCI